METQPNGPKARNSTKPWRPPCLFIMSGGLGNQLFCYAAGLYFGKRHERQIVFEVSEVDLLRQFHTSTIQKLNPKRPVIKLCARSAILRSLALLNAIFGLVSKRKIWYGSPVVGHDPRMELESKALLVRGHFATYRYLLEPEVFDEMSSLSPAEPSSLFSKEISRVENARVLGIHMRLGNYLGHQDTYGSLSPQYFKSAIAAALQNEKEKIDYIYLFSDDIDSASADLELGELGIPIKLFGGGIGLTDEETLFLMSRSDSLIISNSTFSWWAAALGNQDKRVYAPDTWFKGKQDPGELYPPQWELLPADWR